MQERRRFRRFKAEVKVRWRKLSENQELGAETEAVSKNISEGGACLTMEKKEVDLGDILLLEIELPNSVKVTATAKVVWVMANIKSQPWEEEQKSYDAGVEFLDISDEDRDKLEKFAFFVSENKGGGMLYR
jgi:c-di-GMP-binding flagellar brake protein YcgR